MRKMLSTAKKAAIGAGLAGMAAGANAAGYDAITGAANWADAATAVGVVFGAVAVVLVVLTGGRKVLSAIRS